MKILKKQSKNRLIIPGSLQKSLSRPQNIRVGRVTGNKPFSFFGLTWSFGYSPQYQPSTNISPRAKALGLIMGSQVDTSGDNQNAMR